ncbi:MAG: twin-arginine translocase TatA/TatE family subunit [Thermomicrobiales bacterium]|nr:twin-arginine translocase TatA/TatE family subunit [Thermomicrobiales bacterium]
MADLGWQELVIILVIVMIFFGAGKLPEIAKSLGQGVKAFREEANAPAHSSEMAAGGAPGALDLAPASAVVRSRPPLDARDAAEV